MTVLTDLLMQWRRGRLTLTELREKLLASDADGAQLVAALDRHIAAGTLESLLPQQSAPLNIEQPNVAKPAENNKTQVMLPSDFPKSSASTADKTVLLPSNSAVTNEQLFGVAEPPPIKPAAPPVKLDVKPDTPAAAAPSSSAEKIDVTELFRTPNANEPAHTLLRPSSATVVINRSSEDVEDFAGTQVSNAPEAFPKTIPLNVDRAGVQSQPPASLHQPSQGQEQDWLADAFSTSVRAQVSEADGVQNQDSANPRTQVLTHARASEADVFAMATPPQEDVPTELATAPLVPGAVLKDRFLLKEQIGSGGMGSVFAAIDRRKTEARDPNPLVAIKVLDGEFARHSKAFITMQREARKAQELAHPNVVTVFDFDRDDDRIFITMELLRGRSLEPIIREARTRAPEREQVISIIKGIAEGLAHAHRKGFVHSDLKPGNIFLTDDNIPKILDFGIARALPSRKLQEKVKDIFDAGSLGAYTEAYATAEMMSGGEPDPSDDVYALALLAYELFTGSHPYKRHGAVKAREKNLKPAPIKGLKRHEWQLLEDSLAFDRAARPKDAGVFLRRLVGKLPMQKKIVAAIAVLALATLFFWIKSYRAAGPTLSFSQLPAAVQQEFVQDMRQGDELWQFYVKDHNLLALQDATEQYANAYALHPRNRDAVSALTKVADAALDATKSNPEQQREFAQALAERSEYLSKYAPVRKLLR